MREEVTKSLFQMDARRMRMHYTLIIGLLGLESKSESDESHTNHVRILLIGLKQHHLGWFLFDADRGDLQHKRFYKYLNIFKYIWQNLIFPIKLVLQM